jgi:hypothetical protein
MGIATQQNAALLDAVEAVMIVGINSRTLVLWARRGDVVGIGWFIGGPDRDRTDELFHAMERPEPSGYLVFQRTDRRDGDADAVSASQGEAGWGNDAGAGHQKAALGEGVVAVQIVDQRSRIALQFAERHLARERQASGAVNLDGDFGPRRQRAFAHQDTRAESAATVVDLGLRQIERVLTFDIA